MWRMLGDELLHLHQGITRIIESVTNDPEEARARRVGHLPTRMEAPAKLATVEDEVCGSVLGTRRSSPSLRGLGSRDIIRSRIIGIYCFAPYYDPPMDGAKCGEVLVDYHLLSVYFFSVTPTSR